MLDSPVFAICNARSLFPPLGSMVGGKDQTPSFHVTVRYSSAGMEKRDFGITPPKLGPKNWMEMLPKFVKLPMVDGSVPYNPLFCSSAIDKISAREPNSDGMVPVRLLSTGNKKRNGAEKKIWEV